MLFSANHTLCFKLRYNCCCFSVYNRNNNS